MPLTQTTTYDTVTGINVHLDFNWRINGTDANGNAIDQWYPARAVISMTGIASAGGSNTNPVTQEVLLGNVSNTPYTPQQLHNLVKATSDLPALAPAMKAAYLAATAATVN